MLLTGVYQWSLTSTYPLLLVSRPAFSRARPPVKACLPIDTKHTSQSRAFSTPLSLLMFTITPFSLLFYPPSTPVESSNLIPYFLREAKKVLLISASRKGQILGPLLTTVTSVPRRAYTDPISSPITPPPMTTIFLGIDLSTSAPVEETTYYSSVARPEASGRLLGSDPVAIIMFLAEIYSVPPALRSISTVSLEANLPHPCL